jgi:hypothetical protein
VLQAITRISAGGDTEVYLPEHPDQLAEAVWASHLDSVRLAQSHRAESVNAAAAAAARLLAALKDL